MQGSPARAQGPPARAPGPPARAPGPPARAPGPRKAPPAHAHGPPVRAHGPPSRAQWAPAHAHRTPARARGPPARDEGPPSTRARASGEYRYSDTWSPPGPPPQTRFRCRRHCWYGQAPYHCRYGRRRDCTVGPGRATACPCIRPHRPGRRATAGPSRRCCAGDGRSLPPTRCRRRPVGRGDPVPVPGRKYVYSNTFEPFQCFIVFQQI